MLQVFESSIIKRTYRTGTSSGRGRSAVSRNMANLAALETSRTTAATSSTAEATSEATSEIGLRAVARKVI
jgi:hypothetical protein